MSLYNLVHGANPAAPLVLALLGKPPTYFGRFRDAWIEKTEDGIRLAIYTRNGGGNREHWGNDDEAECECPGCIMGKHVKAHPLYLSDADDAYDNTYATIYFKFPDNSQELLRAAGAPDFFDLEQLAVDPPDMCKRWEAAFDSIKKTKV